MSLIEDVHGGQYGVAPRDRQGAGGDDHQITVVSPTMMYYRWVALD
jgi:hypothetical protein